VTAEQPERHGSMAGGLMLSSDGLVGGGSFFGVPRRAPQLIHRPALEARLDEAAMITTIGAGAGFGKTTLLAMWASSRDTAGVWVDASTAPGDRVSFWLNVFHLVSEAGARRGIDPFRDAALPVEGAVSPTTVTQVVATFARSLTSPVVIVVDNAHLIDMDAIGPDLVAFARFAVGSRLVVADRRRRFRPTLLASDVDETRLSGDDLLLDAREIARVVSAVRTRGRGRLAPDEVHRLTNGIPGLVRRVAAHGASRPDRADDLDLLSPWTSHAERALAAPASAPSSSTPDATVTRPHLIAALHTATRDEAAALADITPEEAAAVLESAADHGLGWWPGDDASGRFTFAPIVARAAAGTLARTVPGPERRRVAARFAHIFAVRGDALTGFVLALDAEDFDLAVAIGKRSFLQLVRADPPGLVRRFRRIPLTKLRRQPLLVLFIAILHAQSPSGRAAAVFHFGLAEQLARITESTASPEDRAVMVGVRSATMRMQGKFDKAAPVARDFLDRFDNLRPEEQDRLSSLSRHLLWQVAHTLLFAGEPASALAAAERMLAVPVPSDLVEDRGIRPAYTLMAGIQAAVGSVRDARATLEEAVRHPQRDAPFYAVWERAADAISAIERGEFERARTLVETLDHPIGAGEYWPVDVVVRSLAELGAGRTDAAVRIIESVLDAESPQRQGTAVRDVVVVLRALMSVAGRPAGVAATVLRHVSRPGPLPALAEAVIALRAGDAAAAVDIAGRALGDRPASPRLRAALLLVRAAACDAVAQREAATTAAREAIATMAENGLATPWLLLTSAERVSLLGLAGRDIVDARAVADLDRMPIVFQDGARVERLTAREREVLAQLMGGATVPQVAEASGVSPNTVKTQRARIYRKLGVDNRADAARVALEHDLL
jgi:LuxR family maltose regulon positive regulatory protein